MINDFDDFCLYAYVVIDTIVQSMAALLRRPGPEPHCSDSELLTMSLIGECKGWDVETELLSNMKAHQSLFPHIPTQSRFNRRRRNLMLMHNVIRQSVLAQLDLSQDRQCVIDSLPIPVVQFHLVPSSTGEWSAYEADFGRIASKQQTIFGYKLHLLITMGGLILDFALAPASITDGAVGFELLATHTDLTVIGDKAYINASQAADLWRNNRLRLLTLPRRNQRQQLPPAAAHRINAARQIIETVNGQLTEQFQIEITHARTFWGLCTRLYAKLTAHTLSIFVNRWIGKPNVLHIKALAFPI